MNRNYFKAIFNNTYFARMVSFDDGTTKRCIVQQASDDDLKILPEGDRYNPTLRVMCQSELKNKDLFHWGGFRYRIITNPIWSHYGYYDCLATRYDGSQTADSGGFVIT